MIVVGADQIAQHIITQLLVGLRVRDAHAARAAHGNALDLLGAHDRAHTGAAGVAHACDQAGHVDQVFTGRSDGGHIKLRAAGLGDGRVGRKCALAPQIGGILDGDLVVFDLQVHGCGALPFQNDGVVSGKLDVMRDVAAHVRVHNGIAL